MKYTILGKSDLKVSSICMGCMGFGNPVAGQHSWTVNEEETRRIIGRGLEKGINFFDTAIAYQGGTSEMYVGSALKSLAKRDEYVIATKFTPRTGKEIEDGVNGQTHIKNYIDMSLKNLGMDYVDLYIYHMWDYNTPMEEIMEGLHAVVKAGKARYIGISNCFAWQLAKANYFARANGLTEFISVQGHYNLIAREEEREMAPFCASEGISMTPYSALAGGRLSKRPGESSKRLEEDAYAKFKYDLTKEADEKIIKRVEEVADKRGVSMTEVALGWLIQKGAVPVVGATKDSHVDGAVKAVDLTLTEDEIRYLEELYVPHALVGVMAQNGRR
ncbi:MAG: aldo/keto reductase [Clostridia bacterium]|nr:aldo/keto reductase [Clostridia bacterium]